jgi:hypothetical protein
MEILLKILISAAISAAISAVVSVVTVYLVWWLETRRILRQKEEEWKRERERMELQFWLERGRRGKYENE